MPQHAHRLFDDGLLAVKLSPGRGSRKLSLALVLACGLVPEELELRVPDIGADRLHEQLPDAAGDAAVDAGERRSGPGEDNERSDDVDGLPGEIVKVALRRP